MWQYHRQKCHVKERGKVAKIEELMYSNKIDVEPEM
jgi:hypothetical protein